MQAKVTVTLTGPFITGQPTRVIDAMLAECVEKVAAVTEDEINRQLPKVLQHPTGYYQSRIQTDRQQNDRVVNDSGVIYGPWLEGVSSRNVTTRFKGYATFRKVTQRMTKKATDIVGNVVEQYVRRLN